MTRIHIVGGTGYAGGNLVREANRRGHEVVSSSRHLPEVQEPGVTYVTGSVLDEAYLASIVSNVDVVISAVPPRGELEGRTRGILAHLGELAREAGVRFGVIGGAGSLLVAPGGPRLVDTDGFPEAYKPEALEMADVLDDLRATPADLDWFFVSPAAAFGAHAPGEATGTFRVGGDVLLADDEGQSFISGADLATAIIDEVETPAHHRARFTVAY